MQAHNFTDSITLVISLLRRCPEGYVLRKLKECHVKEVASRWKYSPLGGKELFFASIIKHYHSVGLFLMLDSGEISESPIGWCLQYYYGALAHLFVHENHRRKGLAKVLIRHMCTQVVDDGQVPYVLVAKENDLSISLFTNLGFVEASSRCGFSGSYSNSQ